ncbi:MAG TPA: paraquat-inducible protein A [Gammaproteobacteria bacterium]|nr:paraquat-inducible protein A [Gammaproteobacteria bacterium]
MNQPVRLEASESTLLACHECDTLHRIPPLTPGHTARCRVCGAKLLRNPKGGLDRAIALYSTALILLLLANAFPFLTLEIGGRSEITNMAGASWSLYRAGMPELAVVVFITSIAGPGLLIVCSLYVLLALRLRLRVPGVRLALSWLSHLEPWVMLDVFMLGVLVAFVKLGNMATMHVGTSLYAFVALIGVAAAATSSFEPQLLWQRLGVRRRR